MPSSYKITPALFERRTESTEPALTHAVKQKLALLPDLRRQQLLEQQEALQQGPQPESDLAETKAQSFDQEAKPDLSISHTNKKLKSTTTTRYTISGSMPRTLTATNSPQADPARTTSKIQPTTTNPVSKVRSNSPMLVTDFNVHRGESAVMRPPTIGDDLKSRLEGLRQFKEWSERIHGNPQEGTQPATKVIHQDCTTPAKVALTIEKYSLARAGEESRLSGDEHRSQHHDESRLVETTIVAPTPFCSPQVTPFPLTTVKKDLQDVSASPPSLDLPGRLSPESIAYARPRAHLKTIVISSETPNVQLVPASRTIPQKELTHQVPRRAYSKSRSHPPISFPSDFYERFPTGENLVRPGNVQQSQSRTKTSPGVSPKTTPAIPAADNVIPDAIESLTTSDDERCRPGFYTMIHYFTDCPHSSPPANRPLDASGQPRQDPDFLPTQSQPTRSIIPGACFNCDLASRRDKEDAIIDSCTAHLADLADELAEALNEIELGESDDEEVGAIHDRHSARLLTSSRFAEDKHDLDLETHGVMDLPPLSDDTDVAIAPTTGLLQTAEKKMYMTCLVQRIRDLEVRIQCVPEEQEEQIKKVWAGFTPRWGPGTLGVQRRGRALSTKRAAEVSNEPLELENRVTTPATSADADAVQVVAMNATDYGANSIAACKDRSYTSSRSVSRSRSAVSSRSRSCSQSRNGAPDTPGTVNSVVSSQDLPGSRTPGEGKMKIGWIRGEKE